MRSLPRSRPAGESHGRGGLESHGTSAAGPGGVPAELAALAGPGGASAAPTAPAGPSCRQDRAARLQQRSRLATPHVPRRPPVEQQHRAGCEFRGWIELRAYSSARARSSPAAPGPVAAMAAGRRPRQRGAPRLPDRDRAAGRAPAAPSSASRNQVLNAALLSCCAGTEYGDSRAADRTAAKTSSAQMLRDRVRRRPSAGPAAVMPSSKQVPPFSPTTPGPGLSAATPVRPAGHARASARWGALLSC